MDAAVSSVAFFLTLGKILQFVPSSPTQGKELPELWDRSNRQVLPPLWAGEPGNQGKFLASYYYDDNGRMTDIVRYSVRAQRLLPTNMFSYNSSGNLAGMLLVPEGSNDYQRWYYDYDERGLKTRERAYNKRQEMLGKVEFQYQ